MANSSLIRRPLCFRSTNQAVGLALHGAGVPTFHCSLCIAGAWFVESHSSGGAAAPPENRRAARQIRGVPIVSQSGRVSWVGSEVRLGARSAHLRVQNTGAYNAGAVAGRLRSQAGSRRRDLGRLLLLVRRVARCRRAPAALRCRAVGGAAASHSKLVGVDGHTLGCVVGLQEGGREGVEHVVWVGEGTRVTAGLQGWLTWALSH